MKTWLLRIAIAAVLALGLAAYLRPEFMVDLGNQVLYLCS